MNGNYIIVLIGKDKDDIVNYPDNKKYSHICKYVEDEGSQFIVDLDSDEFWSSNEFFDMNKVRRFIIIE